MDHYTSVDPEDEWKRGFVGYFVTLRGIATAIAIDFGTTIAAYIWLLWVVSVIAVAAGVFVVIWLITVKYYRTQRAASDQCLHFFFHETRDLVGRVSRSNTQKDYRYALDEFHKKAVQKLATFFRERVADGSVNCAIRLAETKGGRRQYATVARSDGLDPAREVHTQPIPHDEGLALNLRNHEHRGVFIIRDLTVAAKGPFWRYTKNDDLTDVKTVMAAPINGWHGETKVMLGILYVTSKKDKFHEGHTLPLKAFADYLGCVYPTIMRNTA